MSDLTSLEIKPIPVTKFEALANHIKTVPDRISAYLKPVDMKQSGEVVMAMGGWKLPSVVLK